MLDINTFIRMVRIVPFGFVAGEDYIFFMTIINSFTAAYFNDMRVPQFYFHISSFTSSNQAAVQIIYFTIYYPAAATFLLHGSSTFWVSGGMLFSNL